MTKKSFIVTCSKFSFLDKRLDDSSILISSGVKIFPVKKISAVPKGSDLFVQKLRQVVIFVNKQILLKESDICRWGRNSIVCL